MKIYSTDLTDSQWSKIEQFFTKRKHSLREIMNYPAACGGVVHSIKHQFSHFDQYHRLTCFRVILEIFANSSVRLEPSKSSFHYPSFSSVRLEPSKSSFHYPSFGYYLKFG